METSSSLEALQILQRDLATTMDGRLENIDRLANELEIHISDFKRLLGRERRNEKSRTQLSQGGTEPSLVTLDGIEYTVTADFREAALIVANELDLDEIEAAKLCLLVQEEMDQVDETLPFRAILRFHTERRTLLDCFRSVLKKSLDDADEPEDVSEMMQTVVRVVVRGEDNVASQSGAYWRKCLESLSEVEEFMAKTQGHLQALSMTGQTIHSVRGEALQVQRMFLAHQHEALAAIMSYLIRTRYIAAEDYRLFLTKAAGSDLPPDLLSHFPAILIAGASFFGPETGASQASAAEIHRMFNGGPAKTVWKNPSLGAAAAVWWIAEYSGREDNPIPLEDFNKIFFEALKHNAFQYILSVADFYKPEVWHDPAKAGLVGFLLDSTTRFPREAVAPTYEFAQLTMQELQNFIEAMVSHMHGALRALKVEEDSQRRNLGLEEQTYEMHLERFLLVIAYAYQDDVSAAMDFWSDTESGLYGFLRWTSRRLPTPRVAAFCEMLRSLANGESAAFSAHKFLLEDTAALPSRGRRAFSLSWQQMFSELELYSSSIKNKPASTLPDATHDPDIIEAETPIMLEAYLRLISHVVRNSSQARDWVLHDQTFKLHECLLQLAQSAIPPSVQACCFDVLSALVYEGSNDVRDGLWLALDRWLSGTDDASRKSQRREQDQLYLQRIASDAEVSSAFVNLLNTLIAPQATRLDELPFPDQIGSTRRQPGMDYYVDFVLAQALPLSAVEQSSTADRMQVYVLRHACLRFIQNCLGDFNENLAVLESNASKQFAPYARQHPFARTMEHLFSDAVIAILFQSAQQNPDELRTLPVTSPLVQTVCLAIEAINLTLDRQATYFDIVRPMIKTQSSRREATVSNPAFASFDDVMLAHLDVVGYLAGYMSSPHEPVCLLAIDLLKRMSASRKISTSSETGASRRSVGRLVNRLSDSSEALQVELRQNFLPQEIGMDSGALHLAKIQAVLGLLVSSLRSNLNIPNLAHCLLGFECEATNVTVIEGSLFSQGKALFHSVASLAISLPVDDAGVRISVLQDVRTSSIEVLSLLSSSTLTGQITIDELHSIDFIPAVQASYQVASEQTLWDGFEAADPHIWLCDGPAVLQSFFREREHLAILAANDDRHARGSKSGVDFVLALLDFYDILPAPPVETESKHFKDFKVDAYTTAGDSPGTLYDIRQCGQSLQLVKRQLMKTGVQDQEQQIDDELSAIVTSVSSINKRRSLTAARLEALEAWVDLALVVVSQSKDLGTLQALLQQVMPKFDRALDVDIEAVSQFAKVVLMVARTVRGLAVTSTTLPALLQEALSHAYRSGLRAIQEGDTDASLRDVCYRVCSVVLELVNSIKAVQINERIVLMMAEDAFASRGVTRISALLFLDATLREAVKSGKPSSLLRVLQKVNFIPVLIEASISNIANVFRDNTVDQSTSLSYFHAATTVLLRIAQIPGGAQVILNSGFVSAVQESGLFSTDPDVGLDIDNASALQEFYRLLAAILRIFVAIVVWRGAGDGGTMQVVRKFLSDNRMSMAAVFKLLSKQDKAQAASQADAREVADELGRLIHITSFLEEDGYVLEAATHRQSFA